MSYHTFDEFGRYVATVDDPTDRSTDVAPAFEPGKTAYWSGEAWINVAAAQPAAAVVAPVVPASVTMRQGREALIRAGLDEAVDAAIDAIPDPVARKIARNAWTMSNNFERHNGFISQLGPAIGLTEDQIDQLFIVADTL